MNVGAIERALARAGQDVTLRRVTGTQRVPFEVKCRASVQTGAATVLVGSVQQAGDRVMFTSRAIDAARWPAPPRHGDQIVYDDGTTVSVQGRATTHRVGEDMVYVVQAIG